MLIKELEKELKPTGRDSEIISGRRDTYFSQKVRNLNSHKTLERLALAYCVNNKWHITSNGISYLLDNNIISLNDDVSSEDLVHILEEQDDIDIVEEIDGSEGDKATTRRIFTTRSLTGSRAEELFLKYVESGEFDWIKGELIDTRLLGKGYDFEDNNHKIEIKGLAEEKGGIQFTDKEWKAAQTYGEHYVVVLFKNVLQGEPYYETMNNPFEKLNPKRQIKKTISITWTVDSI